MEIKNFFEISERIKTASEAALKKAKTKFDEIDEIAEYNQQKVLSAFINNRVSETDFAGSTGYGYGDTGRDKLDRIYADVFGAEDANLFVSLDTFYQAFETSRCATTRIEKVAIASCP